MIVAKHIINKLNIPQIHTYHTMYEDYLNYLFGEVFIMDKEIILVVDDEKEIRDLIGIYLANEGYRVLKASNGLEALNCLEKQEREMSEWAIQKLNQKSTCRT